MENFEKGGRYELERTKIRQLLESDQNFKQVYPNLTLDDLTDEQLQTMLDGDTQLRDFVYKK